MEPTSCCPAAGGCEAISDDERTIRELIADWLRATEAGNVEAVLGLMADDVVFLVPGQKPFGKQAFAAGAQAMQGVRIQAQRAVGVCRTRLRVTMTRSDREPLPNLLTPD